MLTYDIVKKQVEEITDKLGTPVDDEIKNTVIALRLHDFPTSQSCAGHIEKAGLPYPWIEIYEPRQDEELWKSANLAQRYRLAELLEDFYRDTGRDTLFTFQPIGTLNAFRLVPHNQNIIRSEQIRKQSLGDFDGFAEYLIHKQ